jgi:beta-lactamase regulating signal transducer with metallopeptidase domain/type II secretory pathway component GspD/PulD (secretin)
MNSLVETLNLWGNFALRFAWPMLWQSSLLIAALFAMELALRGRVRAAVRHALWLVVLLKLLLPPSLALRTSLAWWLPGSLQPPQKPAVARSYVVTYGNSVQSEPLPIIQRAEPAPAKPSRAAWLLTAWAFGSVGLFGFLLIRWRQMMVEIRETEPAPDWANGLLGEVQNQLNWQRSSRLRLTGRSMSPAVCGFVRPTILLPRALAEKLQPAQLRAVLLHELIHLRRGDVWVNCGQALLQIFYWWHPLLWFANARIRRVREEAVDDAVMLALRDEAESYAPTLLEVAKLAFSRPLASLGLVGILESRNALRQRIERLVNFRAPRRAGLTLSSALGIVTFAAVAAPMNKAPESATVPASVSDSASERLLSVTLKVDPAVFIRNVKARAAEVLRSSSADYTEILLDILRSEGVDCSPPRGIKFNTETGEVTTQNTPENLRVFEEVIRELNLPGGERIRLPHDRKTVLIEAQFYKMRPAEFDQLNLDRPASARRQNAAPWLLSPEKLGQLRQRLKSLGLQPVSSPRIQTAHGVAASLFSGDKTNGISLECLPFISDDGIEIATVARTTGMFNSNPEGDWPTSDGRTNCAVSARVPIENNGGAVLRAENSSGQNANNLVIVLGAKLISETKPSASRSSGGDQSPLVQVQRAAQTTVADATPLSGQTKAAGSSDARRTIVNKLNSIRFDSVYYDGLPLSEVIRNLSDEARKRDPEKRGVNFIINPNVGSAAVPVASATIDPATGLPVGAPATEAVDLKSVSIKIVPAATDVRLADVLDMIVKSADKPIKYAIEDYGVVFLLASTNTPEPLYTRTFKISLDGFYRHTGITASSKPEEYQQGLLKLFSDAGVDFHPPKNMYFKDRQGLLLVRATLADLDALDRLIRSLNKPSTLETNSSRVAVEPLSEMPAKLETLSPTRDINTTDLLTRSYKLDANTFLASLREASQRNVGSGEQLQQTVRDFFAKFGVDSKPPKAIFFNDRNGTLLVRATLQDMDAVESALQVLNYTPPQINIKAKFVEMPEAVAMRFIAGLPTNNLGHSFSSGVLTDAQFHSFSTDVLTAAQSRKALQQLEAQTGVNILTTPEVTTLSGRQAQVQVVDMLTVVKGIKPQALVPPGVTSTNKNDASAYFQTESKPVGPVLDVMPTLEPDGYTITMDVGPTIIEFMGYDRSTNSVSVYVNGKKESVSLPLPRFRIRQVTVHISVRDGQTLVLGNPIRTEISSQPNGEPQSTVIPEDRNKLLFVFVTATIIDPTGNRVHTDKEMPLASKGVPPQKK